MTTMAFDYFYGQQADQFTFYRVPKILFIEDKFWNVSAEAKLLYGILLDRMNLSAKNGWIDEKGRVFVICTIENIMEDLSCGNKKAGQLLSELENKAELIERVRQGLGKPNLIYVKNFISGVENTVERHFLKCQNDTSGDVKKTSLEMSKGHSNNIELNNIEKSNTDFLFFPENSEKTIEEIGMDNPYEIYLKEKLEYDSLVIQYKHHVQMLDEIFEIMTDTLCSNRKTIRIGGDDKPAEIVKSRLMKLEHEHMQFVMDCILENTTKIKNIRQYILTTIYNATQTIDSYYTTLVNHDLYGD